MKNRPLVSGSPRCEHFNEFQRGLRPSSPSPPTPPRGSLPRKKCPHKPREITRALSSFVSWATSFWVQVRSARLARIGGGRVKNCRFSIGIGSFVLIGVGDEKCTVSMIKYCFGAVGEFWLFGRISNWYRIWWR